MFGAQPCEEPLMHLLNFPGSCNQVRASTQRQPPQDEVGRDEAGFVLGIGQEKESELRFWGEGSVSGGPAEGAGCRREVAVIAPLKTELWTPGERPAWL